MMKNFYIGKKRVGKDCPTYFIADIAANHDGNLDKALELINKSAEAGADAAKFQHFKAETIVSDKGFKEIGGASHQKKWEKSVFDVYDDASGRPISPDYPSGNVDIEPVKVPKREIPWIYDFVNPVAVDVDDAGGWLQATPHAVRGCGVPQEGRQGGGCSTSRPSRIQRTSQRAARTNVRVAS